MTTDHVFEQLDWYALRVPPGRERLAAVAVERTGAVCYLPGYRSWVRRSRRAKHLTLKENPMAAGYLFAGFGSKWVNWKRIADLELVVAILSRTQRDSSGPREVWRREPCRLPRTWMIGSGFENLLETAAPERPDYDYGKDDMVLITHGAFDRHPAKCVAIEGVHARVLIEIFGAQREIKIPREMAIKLA